MKIIYYVCFCQLSVLKNAFQQCSLLNLLEMYRFVYMKFHTCYLPGMKLLIGENFLPQRKEKEISIILRNADILQL